MHIHRSRAGRQSKVSQRTHRAPEGWPIRRYECRGSIAREHTDIIVQNAGQHYRSDQFKVFGKKCIPASNPPTNTTYRTANGHANITNHSPYQATKQRSSNLHRTANPSAPSAKQPAVEQPTTPHLNALHVIQFLQFSYLSASGTLAGKLPTTTPQ